MESQPSTHTSLRPTMSTRPSGGVAPTATVYSPSFLSLEHLMMYNNPQLVPTNFVGPCLYSTQLPCTCAFGSPHHTCSLHHAPIAYGQASSSFVPAVVSQQSQQVASNTTTSQSTEQSVQTTEPPSAIQRIDQQSVELARNQTRLPATLANPMRSRMKRAAPSLPPQVQSALEARTPKIRRVASDSVQTVRPETVSQQATASVQTVQQPEAVQTAPPSTSQLVTGTVPSSHQLCNLCTNTQRCASCTPHCLCAMCPQATATAAAARAMVQPTSASVPVAVHAVPASRVLQPVQPAPRPQHQQVLQLQQQVEQQREQLRLIQQQQQQHQQQMLQHSFYRNYIPSAHTVLFPINRGIALDTLLVNVAHPEYLLDRTVDRHHMFAAPVADPQPVGLSVQDIEKYSEKLPFVKDCELPEEEQERCTVCQCELETGEEVRHLSCSHQFHVDCIDRWLGYNKKCPVCRLDIDQPKAVLIE